MGAFVLGAFAGLVYRQTAIALLTGALASFLLFVAVCGGRSIWAVLQICVACWVFLVLFWEGGRLRTRLWQQTKLLRDRHIKPPDRLDRKAKSLVPSVALLFGLFVAFVLRFIGTGGAAKIGPIELGFVFLALRSCLGLLGGAFTRAQLNRATRGMPHATTVPTSFPLLAVGQAVVGVSMIMSRTPIVLLGKLFVVVLAATLQGAVDRLSPREVEWLVELGPDDNIRDISSIVRTHASTATAVAHTGAPGELGRTYVISSPALYALPLFLALDAEKHHVEEIEWNAVLDVPETAGSASCATEAATPERRRLFDLESMRDPALAVIDQGVDGEHEALSSSVTIGGRSWNGEHGTAVAGTAVLARTTSDWASADTHFFVHDHPLPTQQPAADDIARAVLSAVDDDAKVIVLALTGKGQAPDIVTDAIAHALARDVLVIAAAGNRGRRGRGASMEWPANVPGVLAVTSHDGNERAPSSNSPDVPLVLGAPGSAVCAPVPKNRYERRNGTSFAAAKVAGAAAMARSACPADSAEDTLSRLLSTARRGAAGEETTMDMDALMQSNCRR